MTNSYALVTGASTGIGKAYAYTLAERGYNLIRVARRKKLLLEIAKDIGNLYRKKISVVCYETSLTNRIARKKLMEDISKKVEKKPLTILVNNAGFGDCGEFETSNLNKQLSMITLNISALVELTRLCMPLITKRVQIARVTEGTATGYIINIASVAGFQPGPYMANYYATKAYVLSFTEAVAEECERNHNGIHMSVVCPGPTLTEFGDVAGFDKAGSKLSQMFVKRRNKIPSAKSLAEYSLQQVFLKKRVIIYGRTFKFLQFVSRFLTRDTITKLTGDFQEKRVNK